MTTFLSNEHPIPENIMKNWQRIVNLVAKLFEVPVALIMRVHSTYIEVFKASENPGNPYEIGEKSELAGLYCNKVMQDKKMLLVSNALLDPEWDHNPDIKLGMISYLGFPIMWPNGEIFGTICVLDRKENKYSEVLIDLLREFKFLIENHLDIIMKTDKIEELFNDIQKYEKIMPICAKCRKIKTDQDIWISLDEYLTRKTGYNFSHGLCPDCLKEYEKQIAKF